MADVTARFSDALRRRLNGQLDGRADLQGALTVLSAKAAGIDPQVVSMATAEAMGLEFREKLSGCHASHDFIGAIPISFARKHGLIALASTNGDMPVVMADVGQWPQLQAISKLLQKSVHPILAPRGEIMHFINLAYQQPTGQAQHVIEELDKDTVLGQVHGSHLNEDLLDVASRAPVIKLVNLMLFEAVKRRASDVHLQPYEDSLVVRLRIDGVLYDIFKPPKNLQEEIISRIKVMGGMNIAERRLAQDGRATVEVGDRIVDLRIATLPTSFGERAVIRLLDKSARLYRLPELGMPANVLLGFSKLIQMDHGIILVTGPTGSGKSTTLYAALQELNSLEFNILTLEDPIEYRLSGISQTQISDRKGMTFASGLRHVLRQDPDIIMVGEIRDAETAHMAIQSALTGHLVFSTLHTNDAAGAVARMLDLGVEPYLLASCLLGVLAQRLVRRICPDCKVPHVPSSEERLRWSLAGDVDLYKGKGCDACLQTGYRERVGIFELLTVTEPTRELILQRSKASSIKAQAASAGMTTLRADGLIKAANGITTMDEVARMTGLDDF